MLREHRFKGPNALKLLSETSVNSLAKVDPNQSKHVIHCNDDGKVSHEGILTLLGEHGLDLSSYSAHRWSMQRERLTLSVTPRLLQITYRFQWSRSQRFEARLNCRGLCYEHPCCLQRLKESTR
ncbi:hypothetical protein IVB42_08965 [Bradyrhizobium sp. 45]|nr:hypothetical protein [Bradyrhizobium sp. 45]